VDGCSRRSPGRNHAQGLGSYERLCRWHAHVVPDNGVWVWVWVCVCVGVCACVHVCVRERESVCVYTDELTLLENVRYSRYLAYSPIPLSTQPTHEPTTALNLLNLLDLLYIYIYVYYPRLFVNGACSRARRLF
jgi:hypothetical protein